MISSVGRCCACALVALSCAGCVFWPRGERVGVGLDASDVSDAITGDDSEQTHEEIFEDDSIEFGSFSWDNLKKLTGQGPNRDLARQLYREGDDLYRQATA